MNIGRLLMWCGQLQAGYTCGWADWLGGALSCRIPLKSTETNTIDVAKHNMLWHSFSINVRMRGAKKQIAHTCLTSVSEASQLQRLRGMLSRLMASLYNSIQLAKSRGCALLPEIHESHLNCMTGFSLDTVVSLTCFLALPLTESPGFGRYKPDFCPLLPRLLFLFFVPWSSAETWVTEICWEEEDPVECWETTEPFETFRGTSETQDCRRSIHKQA